VFLSAGSGILAALITTTVAAGVGIRTSDQELQAEFDRSTVEFMRAERRALYDKMMQHEEAVDNEFWAYVEKLRPLGPGELKSEQARNTKAYSPALSRLNSDDREILQLEEPESDVYMCYRWMLQGHVERRAELFQESSLGWLRLQSDGQINKGWSGQIDREKAFSASVRATFTGRQVPAGVRSACRS